MQDEEFDVRPYLRAIARSWRWLSASIGLAAVVTVLAALSLPRHYAATAALLLRPNSSQIALDPRFVTNNVPDMQLYRQGILAMADSDALAMRVPPETMAALGFGGKEPGSLHSSITVKLAGNLLLISARAPSAEQAKARTDAWSAALVAYANEAYTPAGLTPETADVQLRDGRARLATAQSAYEAHIASSQQAELDHEIATVTETLESARKADQARYTLYLTRVQEIDSLIDDVATLRADIVAGRAVNLGDQLASLALRARATNSGSLPIQLQLTAPQVLDTADDLSPARLSALQQQLETQRAALKTVAAELANALASDTSTDQTTLSPPARAAYFTRLQELQRAREIERATEQALAQNRDIALEALQVLQRKIAEQQITMSSGGAPVRIANAAALPLEPAPRRLLVKAATGALVGLGIGVLGIVLHVGLGLPLGAPRTPRRAPPVYTRPADSDLAAR